MSDSMASNRSMLKDFLASISVMHGDLSNITAPPFVLAENSTVELPQYWADHPKIFVAPATEPQAEKRALLVLKWFIGSLRNQQYAGRGEDQGVKKPLNAFLGELFLGSWKDEELGETRLLSEQVSHRPPITACYLWNDKYGVRAEGFTQQEITFSGSISIKQKGYAVLHVDKYDEDYLIPVPNIKVKGVLSGKPYPELHGEYSLISSNGYVSHIKFEGKGLLGGGEKNGFEARLFHVDRPSEDIYTVKGAWNGRSLIQDARTGQDIETFDVTALESMSLEVADLAEQDEWESRKAWQDVIAALRRGDMKTTANAKSLIEQGQREMRKEEESSGKKWKSTFFQSVQSDPIFDKLSVHDNGSFVVDREGGVWKVDRDAVRDAKKPYHGDLLPTNQRTGHAVVGEPEHLDDLQEQHRSDAAVNGVSKLSATSDEAPRRVSNGTNGTNGEKIQESDREQESRAPTQIKQEPTDAAVEAFLREKYSSSH